MSTPTLMLQVSDITANHTFKNLAYMNEKEISNMIKSGLSPSMLKKNCHVVVNDELVVPIRYPILQLINFLFKTILLHSNAIN